MRLLFLGLFVGKNLLVELELGYEAFYLFHAN